MSVLAWSPQLEKASDQLEQLVYDYLSVGYPNQVLTWVNDATWFYGGFVKLDDVEDRPRPGGPPNKKQLKRAIKAFRGGHDMHAPIILVKTPNSSVYKIADGWTRVQAAREAGVPALQAIVGRVKITDGPWGETMNEAKLNR